ncbi:MAG: hypothetical protein Unbinned1473contig1000_55 [Prokaryotic dsDNA virus sp.]|nr:MAG: hypothetical protein Unbinned1473contig1000_55 [Prokaryotic dsDNA virus sp.]|tara:strand:- start:6110 stop:6283 length:174 start_codon:yes stop_codon:yes gene_type:complete
MKIYRRETTVTYVISDIVEANSYEEAESLPITQEVPEGAIVEKPIAITYEVLDGGEA